MVGAQLHEIRIHEAALLVDMSLDSFLIVDPNLRKKLQEPTAHIGRGDLLLCRNLHWLMGSEGMTRLSTLQSQDDEVAIAFWLEIDLKSS